MRWIAFLSRVAFICNLFFLLSVSLYMYDWAGDIKLVSTIIILGYVFAFVLNPVTVFTYMVVLMLKRSLLASVPVWLMVANAVFLVLQLLFIIYLNDTRDY